MSRSILCSSHDSGSTGFLFIADSPEHDKVKELLTNQSLVSGIQQASPLSQTSCLEGFHSVLNHFAPKMLAFTHSGMNCRFVGNRNYLIQFVYNRLFREPVLGSKLLACLQQSLGWSNIFIYFYAKG